MKNYLAVLSTAGFLFASTAAIAATGDFEKADANADGELTLEEGMVVHSDWTEDAFKALDTDANGTVSKQEYDAAKMKSGG